MKKNFLYFLCLLESLVSNDTFGDVGSEEEDINNSVDTHDTVVIDIISGSKTQ